MPTTLNISGPTLSANNWPSFKYEPQKDITAYELALCLPAIFAARNGSPWMISDMISQLPPEVRRHFVELPFG